MSHPGSYWPLVASLAALGPVACGSPPSVVVQPSGTSYDSATVEPVASGVVHRRLVAREGPFTIQVLEIDLRRSDLSVRGARALDSLRGRERTSDIARRRARGGAEVIAAVNADFFSLRTGENENNQVIDGEVFKAVPVTDSPFDSLHTVHSQFGMTCEGKPVIDRFAFDGAVMTAPPAAAILPLDAVNFRPRGDAMVLYTARYGTTPSDSAAGVAVELPLRLANRRGDTLYYRSDGPPVTGGGLALRETQAALSATGIAADLLRRVAASLAPSSQLRVVTGFKPKRGRLCTLVGGWPRLIVDGRSIADSVDRIEGTFPRFSLTRHPRTGVGFSRDSTTLYLLTVDGRSESSSGMSLVELAALMRSLGVHQGMNFDGGGSTTMVIRGQVVNHPSDSTGERTVGNAVLVVRGKRG